MKTLREYAQEQLDTDPRYAEARREADAELELSERLLDLREELGLSQRAAAERVGIKAPHLSRLEASLSLPTLHTIWKLADAYGACFTFGPDYSVDVRSAIVPGYVQQRGRTVELRVGPVASGVEEHDEVTWGDVGIGSPQGERRLSSFPAGRHAA